MKFMQVYGPPLASYEGGVIAGDNETYQERGYFEAVQSPNGQITIGCFFPNYAWKNAEDDIRNHNLRYFDYHSGWSLQTEEGIHLSQRMHSMYEVVIRASKLRAKKSSLRETPKHEYFRFAIANLVLGGRYNRPSQPNPISFSFQGNSLKIKPVEDYPDRIARLQSVGGVEHTADIIIRPHGKDMKDMNSLDEAATLIEDLIPVLRLWSGNKLNWIYGEGYCYSNYPSEILRQSPIVSGHSDDIFCYGWSTHIPGYPSVTLCELAEKAFAMQEANLSKKTLMAHIDGFADACKTSQSWETKAITAATLLDALAAQYAEAQGKSEIMPENDFNQDVLPTLKKTIKSLELQKAVKEQLKDKVQGLYRTSMRRKIKLLSDRLSLSMKSKLRGRVVNVRNELVHEGRFPDKDRSLEDCKLLLWMNFVVLCRLVGYEGKLPLPPPTK